MNGDDGNSNEKKDPKAVQRQHHGLQQGAIGTRVVAVPKICRSVDVEPFNLPCVVSGLEVEHSTQLRAAVEVVGGRLHPCVVRVARVVDI